MQRIMKGCREGPNRADQVTEDENENKEITLCITRAGSKEFDLQSSTESHWHLREILARVFA